MKTRYLLSLSLSTQLLVHDYLDMQFMYPVTQQPFVLHIIPSVGFDIGKRMSH